MPSILDMDDLPLHRLA